MNASFTILKFNFNSYPAVYKKTTDEKNQFGRCNCNLLLSHQKLHREGTNMEERTSFTRVMTYKNKIHIIILTKPTRFHIIKQQQQHKYSIYVM